VINADGTGVRQVSADGRSYQALGLDWSPDGQWLVARSDSTVDLIQVATGLTLPLGYATGYTLASWKR
jgi:Tol biopolymer transport system component